MFGLFVSLEVSAVEESTSILISVAPANPAPGEDVTLTLNSYAEDLNSVLISWSAGGTNIASGVGKKSVSVKAPALGSQTTVVATISLPTGATQVSVILKPSEMILLWEAEDSYVPPFYKGKALAPPDTFVKVVAMPEIRSGGSLVNSTNLVYAWQKDFNNVQDSSGYGKNYFTFRNDYLENSNNVGVTATTTDQKFSSAARINIGMATPLISFYKKDSNLGTLWENAIGNNHSIRESEVVVAAPYFISPRDIRRPDLIFRWFINDSPVTVDNYTKSSIPLKVEEGTSGVSKLRLLINSTDKIFETAEKEINIEF